MVIKNESDVEKYTDPRFRVAALIGKSFIHALEHQLSPQQKNEFIQYPTFCSPSPLLLLLHFKVWL